MFLKGIGRAALRLAQEPGAGDKFSAFNALALAVDHYAFSTKASGAPNLALLSPSHQKVLAEVKDVGFSAIENFVSQSECENLRQLLTKRLAENPSLLHPGTQNDQRLHGIENVESTFRSFTENTELRKLASAYLQRPSRVAFTLGACLRVVEGGLGSGGGWHRDSITPQFKTMLYLTDVSVDNGPFQVLERSHHLLQTIKDNRAAGLAYGKVRITQEQVDKVLESSSHDRLHTLNYPAGTLLIFDSSTIHRGRPIYSGTRMALTNYFYPESQIDSELYRHFQPVAGHLQ